MITAKEISFIRDQIVKAGKVAPVDVDKLIPRLLNVLNAKLEARVLNESGLSTLLAKYRVRERARLDTLHANSLAEEKERLKSEFNAKLREVESRTARRIGKAEYAESVVESLKVILGLIFKAWRENEEC